MLVVMPFLDREADIVLANLDLCEKWRSGHAHVCLLAYERGTRSVQAIRAMAQRCFSAVALFEYDKAPDPKWPQGPNWAWQSTARHIESTFKDSWFWWESDAVPIAAEWIRDIDSEHQNGRMPFTGHRVLEMGHMNGVMVYPNNISRYAYNAMLCRSAAWDVVLSAETKGYQHECNHLIEHVWNLDEQGSPTNGVGNPPSFTSLHQLKSMCKPSTVLIHRCKDGSIQRLLNAELMTSSFARIRRTSSGLRSASRQSRSTALVSAM